MGSRDFNPALQAAHLRQIPLAEDDGGRVLLHVGRIRDWETPTRDRYSEPHGSELARVNAAPEEPPPAERPLSYVANDPPDPRTLDRARAFRVTLSQEFGQDDQDAFLRDPRASVPLRQVRRLIQEMDHVSRSAQERLTGLRLQAAHLLNQCSRTPTGREAIRQRLPRLFELLAAVEQPHGLADQMEMALTEFDESGIGDDEPQAAAHPMSFGLF